VNPKPLKAMARDEALDPDGIAMELLLKYVS
jgi:hypothetical protein